MSGDYSTDLAARLAAGAAGFPADRAVVHRDFIASFEAPDGGFRGREGDSDLYYTAFAARSWAMLVAAGRPPAADQVARLSAFLDEHAPETLDVIDLVSWLTSATIARALGGQDVLAPFLGDSPKIRAIDTWLQTRRRDDGGYSKSLEGVSGSTYHSFLALLVRQMMNLPEPEPDRLADFFLERQRDDGGFVEIRQMKRSGTNPTAAAVASLRILGRWDEDDAEDVREFLAEVRSSEGGYQANTRIPFADCLSTFTAMLTLLDMGCGEDLNRPALTAYLDAMEQEPGGYAAASWDMNSDVEYAFYGLAARALLATTSS